MFSVIIPLYNKEKYIARTIQSVLRQTYDNFEIIIVDDGSTDNSLCEVKKFYDERIRIFSQKNSGVSAARNRGVEESKYDLIAFVDADDEWLPNYLSTIYSMVKKYEDCSVYATSYYIDTNGVITANNVKELEFNNDGVMDDYFHIASINTPPLWTSAITVNKTVLKKIGSFPIGIKSGEDLLTWARLAVTNKIAYTKICLSIYHNDVEKWDAGRPTDQIDIVGEELKKLLITIDKKHYKSLKMYIGLWHKMRASTFLRHNQRLLTLKESLLSVYYSPFNYKIYLFIFLTIMPSSFIKYVFRRA